MERSYVKATLASADLKAAANAASTALAADVLFFGGDIAMASAEQLIRECRQRNRRQNVLLVLVTSGGHANAAFRIARCLQQKYTDFYVYVPGWCKSSGTLIASGAKTIYMGDFGELGPLDIQISKKDEIWAVSSILNVNAAIQALMSISKKMYFDYLYEIKEYNRSVTYKTAADIAVDLTGKLLAPVYSQIDPSEIGENSRFMDITQNYAQRLNNHAKNFRSEETMSFLVQSYPDHGFVIDRAEAKEIFVNVLEATAEMEDIEEHLGRMAIEPLDATESDWFEVLFLSDEMPKLSVVPSNKAGGP